MSRRPTLPTAPAVAASSELQLLGNPLHPQLTCAGARSAQPARRTSTSSPPTVRPDLRVRAAGLHAALLDGMECAAHFRTELHGIELSLGRLRTAQPFPTFVMRRVWAASARSHAYRAAHSSSRLCFLRCCAATSRVARMERRKRKPAA